MKERKETINLEAANVWAIVVMLVAAVVGLPYYWFVAKAMGYDAWATVKSFSFADGVIPWMLLVYVAVCMLGVIVHELVHGITWACYCKQGWRSISFGVIWKMLTPYCHCSEPLKKRDYMTGALMPLMVVGVLPLLASPFIPSFGMCLFGIFYIGGASGDMMVAWKLRKENPACAILDHPTEAGYLVYEEDDV